MRNREAKKTMDLLRQALNAAQGSDMLETRKSIQQAMTKLESAVSRRDTRRVESDTQAQKWWKNVVSGVTNGTVSGSAAMRNLEQINSMIGKEKKAIDTIEQDVAAQIAPKMLRD